MSKSRRLDIREGVAAVDPYQDISGTFELFRGFEPFEGDCLASFVGDRRPENPLIWSVKSRIKFVVFPSSLLGPYLWPLGVGEGERLFIGRRAVAGVFIWVLRGVGPMPEYLVGLCPIFANMVMSGTAEKVLKVLTMVSSCRCFNINNCSNSANG